MVTSVNYGLIEQWMHRIAFSSPLIQLTAADIEDWVLAGQFREITAVRPIFITSLPRAGTTVLLEALYRLPSIATYVYRDMPFIMAPVLWSRLSLPFRRHSLMRERAHGDGLRIGYDSPEAFEEVLWRTFSPEKYTFQQIPFWSSSDLNEEARCFFRSHMKKIISLRCPRGGRYLSKNNNNLARINLLAEIFPDGSIIVPIRRPLDHARSLLRQHKNFLTLHAKYPFIVRYMADIGHFEFGVLHRPIAFPGFKNFVNEHDVQSLDYWLGYWVAAFEHILSQADKVMFISVESFQREPSVSMGKLCDLLGIEDRDGLDAAVSLFRNSQQRDVTQTDSELCRRAEVLYRELLARSLV